MCTKCGVTKEKSEVRIPDNKWSCPFCKTKDLSLRYKGTTLACHECMRWYNINHNAKMIWRNVNPDVAMTKEEYIGWCNQTPPDERTCEYCGIPQPYLRKLNQMTDIGYVTQAMGVDRVDSKGAYSVDNIVWCCAGCNKAKSDSLSYNEMKSIVGPSMRTVWLLRLGYSMEQIEASKASGETK